ncbi:hypothetical protein GCM10010307_71180 [Streptomyces vastus]|uniref:IrrE N-terminal-like domain-containing protein n=2 Tax=Streptomyces vastus TaxID=285451 RepID=A0ABN3RNF8_9ACTN
MNEQGSAPITTSWELPGEEDHSVGMRNERRRVRALLKKFGLPAHPTLDQLVTAYEAQTGRELLFIERELQPGEPSGLYERYLTQDRIYYPRHTSPAHQNLVKCHELAHLLLGHQPRATTIAPDVVRRVLGRSHYDDPAEHEAETIGRVLYLELNLAPDEGSAPHIAPSLVHREGRHV